MRRQRLAQSLLLVGENDEDKSDLARYFAQMLLCEKSTVANEEIRPCNACIDCKQIASQRHANIEWVACAPSEEIKIEQIREVKERLRLSSFNNKARLIVLPDANALTIQAANALLKSIEEPNVGHYFLLMAKSSSALLKTLVSRCQRLVIQSSKESTATMSELSQYAEELFNRINSNGIAARMTLVDEIEKKECEKTLLLLELQKRLHKELRTNSILKTKDERSVLLKSIKATVHSRQLLEQNANTRLTLEHWLLNAWPIEP